MCVTIKKRTLEKLLAIMLLVIKTGLINILVIVEHVLPPVSFRYMYITVP